jgi:flagellar hook-associated protein 2
VYSQGMFSIGGIASGLDTQGIIQQLMQLERQPVKRLESQQAQLRKADEAWGQVNTKLSTLRKAVDQLSRVGNFDKLITASSSNEDVASATTTGGAETGSLSFRVTQLAQRHQVASGTFAAADQPLNSTQPLEVTIGDQTVEVAVDGRTLNDVARDLNEQGSGFTASVVRVSDGEYRLMLTADKTGTANTLSVESDLAELTTGSQTLQQAQNSRVQLGIGADALTIERSSNTIDDLVPGASVTLKRVSDDPVTVTTSRDVDGGVKAVKEYVDALNGVIKTISDLSKADPASGTGGVLSGDATARQLLTNLRSAANAPLGTSFGEFNSAHQIGIEVDRYGVVTLDETKLRTALEADFDAVGRLFSRSISATSTEVSRLSGTSTTVPGTYEVEVTQAAALAQASAALTAPNNNNQPRSFNILSGDRVAAVMLDRNMTSEDILATIEEALAAADIGDVTARLNQAGEITLEATRYGSASSFTVESVDGYDVGALAGTHTGVDAAGRIRTVGSAEWTDLVGAGRELKATTGDAAGLSFQYAGGVGGFEVAFTRGLAGGMSDVLARAEGTNGMVARARQSLTNRIDLFQDRIDGFERRLELRESTIRRQFTAMESMMGTLNSQGQWLQGQLAGLMGGNQR